LIKRRTKIKKSTNDVDLRTSTQNLLLNIIIFVLLVVVIYLSYSIFLKLKLEVGTEPVSQGNNLTPSEIIQVEVLNGCGVSGLADRFTDYLRDRGFDVVNKGNYIQFDIEKTMIIDRMGNAANTKEIAKSLGVNESNIITQINEDYFLDVSVIIGSDYYKLSPLK
jgi:hypothetical protein